MRELTFRTDLPAPWSLPFAGPAALALVACALALVTVWAYARRPEASRRRVALLVALRLLALVLALVTAIRPSVGVRETPKLPSVLVIGVDRSQSMGVPDELGNAPRYEAVRKELAAAQPILDELKAEQNVETHVLAFGASDFSPDADRYDPALAPDLPRSDYAAYLKKTFERYRAEPLVRGHFVIGDGIDNGPDKPEPEAARWRQQGVRLDTFAVGQATTDEKSKDVAVVSATPTTGSADGAVPVKSDFTLRMVANAYGFVGARVPVKVQFDDGTGYKDALNLEGVPLDQEAGNAVDLKLKAPDKPGQLKVRIEIPAAAVAGDVAPVNNVLETYLTVSKEGLRILVINRASVENAAIRRALKSDSRRVDYVELIRQTDDPPSPSESAALDFDSRAYDVILVGNVSARQLTTLDPRFAAKLRAQVLDRGVGLIFTGGHATLKGDPRYPDAGGWVGTPEVEQLLPVALSEAGKVPESVARNPEARFQYVPTLAHQSHYLNRLADTTAASNALWARLDAESNRLRLAGVSPLGRVKETATVYALADPGRANAAIPAPPGAADRLPPLLVGHQIGAGDRGRVLVLAAQDTYLWQALGQPKSRDGVDLHARFWRQLVRWAAHQDEDDGQVFARAELPRMPTRTQQTIRIGVRQPGGAPALNPRFPTVKILAPGEAESAAPERAYFPDSEGVFRVPFEPTAPGEYTVKVVGEGADVKGGPITGEAQTRFLVYAVATEEALIKAARPEALQRLASAGGGQARRLESLADALRELKNTPIDQNKPRPVYYPDWRRDQSGGFLPAWMVLFALVLAAEWGLRRYWGLV